MKFKYLFIAIIAALGPVLLAAPAQAAGSATLSLSPATGTYSLGQTIATTISVDTGGDPVNAIEADLTYPTDKLAFQSFDATNSAFAIAAVATVKPGHIAIARGSIAPVTGAAQFATVRFTVIGQGPAALNFEPTSAVVTSTDNTDALSSTTGAAYILTGPAHHHRSLSPWAQKLLKWLHS